jgi:anti-sigma B factor antagonist
LQRGVWERCAAALVSDEVVSLSSSNGFRIAFEPDRERITLHVLGEIDIATAGDMEDPLLDLLDSGFETIVLDLREVTFLDSSGIRVLINSHQYAQECAARLSIVVGTSRSREVLELSGAIDHLDIS